MRLHRARRGHAALMALLLACGPAASWAAVPAGLVDSSAVVALPFSVDLGGFTTQAELTYPAPRGSFGEGPYPLVLLIHGNGPQDMDATLPGPRQSLRLFRDLAQTLSAHGLAVARYHKRYVTGPNQFDARFWAEQSTRQFADDAEAVLDAARALDLVDEGQVFLYGWSEGTAIGAAVAARRDDIEGLVLHGAVGLPYREMARHWVAEVGAAYARSFAPSDTITAESLQQAAAGPGGLVAKLGAAFLTDPSVRQTWTWAVSSYVDADADGTLSPAEVDGHLDEVLDYMFSPAGNLYVYAPGRTVPTVTEQAAALDMPVLILQGEHDASTPPASARRLAEALQAAGHTAVTLREYAGLGHTLGSATSAIDDLTRPMAPHVAADVAAWLRALVNAD
ncbi:MAG: alpha/beta fold hydrolase [Bacteroidota bacterium]